MTVLEVLCCTVGRGWKDTELTSIRSPTQWAEC